MAKVPFVLDDAQTLTHIDQCSSLQGASILGDIGVHSKGSLPAPAAIPAATSTRSPEDLCVQAMTLLQQLQTQLSQQPCQQQQQMHQQHRGAEQPGVPHPHQSLQQEDHAQHPSTASGGPNVSSEQEFASRSPPPVSPSTEQRAQYPLSAPPAPNLRFPFFAPVTTGNIVIELNVGGDVMHALQGALFLAGPCSMLSAACGLVPGSADVSSTSTAAPAEKGCTSAAVARDSGGRPFLPYRPHVFRAVLGFLHELWAFRPHHFAEAVSQADSDAAAAVGSTPCPEEQQQHPQLLQQQKHGHGEMPHISSVPGSCLGNSATGLASMQPAVVWAVQEATKDLLHAAVQPCDVPYLHRLCTHLGLQHLMEVDLPSYIKEGASGNGQHVDAGRPGRVQWQSGYFNAGLPVQAQGAVLGNDAAGYMTAGTERSSGLVPGSMNMYALMQALSDRDA